MRKVIEFLGQELEKEAEKYQKSKNSSQLQNNIQGIQDPENLIADSFLDKNINNS